MKILFVSLGCDKNLTDSEKLIGALTLAGHEMTDDEELAEAVVINTCCFIGDAKQESIETILELAELKKTAALKYIVVTGCLAQRYRGEILASIPEVDLVIGPTAVDGLCDALAALDESSTLVECCARNQMRLKTASKEAKSIADRVIVMDASRDFVLPGRRVRSDIMHYSYLKIAEGCDKHCTYCIIPELKGHYRSIPMEALLSEAEALVEDGVTEIMVIAQETTLYGTDLYGKKMLPELLKKLCRIEGLELVRLMYCYPEEITDELIQAMASEPKICHYIDMPIQHASDDILKRMGRKTDRNALCSVIGRLRDAMPDIVIRTSLITGFPGETEEDHRILYEFLSELRLDRVGVFTYSREENTPAYGMKPQVHASTAKRRRKELMLLQQEIVFDKNASLVGKVLDVVIDGKLPDEDVYVGRTYMDAPGIDACVFVRSDRDIISGTTTGVMIEDFKDYDLIGTET